MSVTCECCHETFTDVRATVGDGAITYYHKAGDSLPVAVEAAKPGCTPLVACRSCIAKAAKARKTP